MKDIIVLAGSTPWSVLSLCKFAHKNKAKTFVVCVNNGWGKKYGKSKYVYRAYDVEERGLALFWRNLMGENLFSSKPILYVTNDYVCQIVNDNREFYENYFTPCLASSYIIESFLDKNKASIEASRHGLTVPKTMELYDSGSIEAVSSLFSFPVIVKPVTFKDHSDAGFKTRICETEQELKSFVIPFFEKKIHLQCQEFILGEDKDCVFYQFFRDKNGEIVECMGEKTLQSNGIMTIGTTKFDDTLAKICRTFLNSIDYVGIGGIEFKKHEGKYYFIEMSTRTEGFLPISDMAGVSLANASYMAMNGNRIKPLSQKEDINYVVFISWLLRIFNKKGIIAVIKDFFKMTFSPKYFFVGSYLDKSWVVKLYLKLLD